VALNTRVPLTPFDPSTDTYLPPNRDRRGLNDWESFGSAHPTVCNFAFCDGSVHGITFLIDPEVHRRFGNRLDRLVIDRSGVPD
jgi:prepilin-type processing-associated H-X9-DG protein